MNIWNEIKSLRCYDCFWSDVSVEKWEDFEGYWKSSLTKEEQIQNIKKKKCQECNSGINNFSKKWTCRECGIIIDGHQEFFHSSLCENCWQFMVNSQYGDMVKKTI